MEVYNSNPKKSATSDFYEGDEDDEYGDEAQMQRLKELNREAFKSMMFFVAFLTIFTVVVVSNQSENTSRFVDQVRQKIQDGPVPLHTVTTIPTYWRYLEGTLMPAMYPHNEDTRMAGNETQQLHPLDLSNRLMGGIRMRQIRVVQKEACQVGSLFQQYKTICYPAYSEQLTETQESFGPKKKFRWSEDGDGSPHSGKLASYSPNGFMQTFSTNKTRTNMEMRALKEEDFLDAATRAVMVDFTIWNSNLGLYAVSRITHEFAPSGAVDGSVRVLIMAERYFTPGGTKTLGEWFAIIGEVAIIIFVVFYLGEEFSECSVMKWDYLKDGWNLMDWLNMFLLLYAFGSRMTVWVDSVSLTVGEKELLNRDEYTNLQAFAESIEQAGLINAFNAVLLWAKFFKFSGYVPYVKILIQAIGGSFFLFISFLAMFVIAFVGFVISYNVGFGDKINEFATFHGACVYLGRSFLGDIDLLPVFRVSPLFGAVLILLFYVMIMMVGMNVFFAILTNALHESKYGDKANNDDDEAVLTQIWADGKQWFFKKIEFEKKLKTYFPAQYKKYKQRQSQQQAKKATVELQDNSAIVDQKNGTQYSSSSSSSSSSYSMDSYEAAQRPVSSFKAKEVMQSVEHMAGRILSRVQGMGIEIRSEVLDVYEKMAMMDLAVSELTRRAKVIEIEQEAMMSE